jgi:hypothetical protein
LSAGFSVCAPAGGEMSGPKAHFLFAAKVALKPLKIRGIREF